MVQVTHIYIIDKWKKNKKKNKPEKLRVGIYINIKIILNSIPFSWEIKLKQEKKKIN